MHSSFILLMRGNMQVKHIQSRVAEVQPGTRTRDGGSVGGGTVMLEGGEEVAYDWLVLALGAETNMALGEGAKEHAIGFSTLEDAKRVRPVNAVCTRHTIPKSFLGFPLSMWMQYCCKKIHTYAKRMFKGSSSASAFKIISTVFLIL